MQTNKALSDIQGLSMPERYFTFLRTPYQKEDVTAYPAGARYVDALREVQAAYRPRWDLSACLAGTQPGFTGKVWFWSDLHLGHANIIEYCKRPFTDVPDMDASLLRNCLSTVSSEDILVFGGDLCIKGVAVANDMLRQIPAYKINVLGNHDVHKRKPLNLEMDEVCACLEFEFEGVPYFLSHQPVKEQVLAAGQVNMHGHLHDTALHPNLGDGGRHLNISVEGIGFMPRTLPELLANKAHFNP